MEDPKYQSNRLSDLKREALANLDLGTLGLIASYEESQKRRKTYFVRENEIIIRNREGEPINHRELPFEWSETHMHYLDYEMGKVLSRTPDDAGALIRDIHFVTNEHHFDYSVLILEVEDETIFPLSDDFNWYEMCNRQPKREDYLHRNFRLSGQEPTKTYYWKDHRGNNMITMSPPEEGVDFTFKTTW